MNPLQGLLLVLEAAVQTVGVRAGVEQPAYQVLERHGALELRRYPPRVVAETTVAARDETAARNQGFQKVAGYIFGGNQGGRQVAMTAPVSQGRGETIAMTAPVVQARGETIAMTAPVAQASAVGGAWTIQFVMPAKYRLDSLPRPNDPSVRLVEEPAARYAVLRFSGSREPKAVARRTESLMSGVAAQGWKPAAAPVAWFYDPPWTVPVFRRNEVAVRID